MQIVTNQANTGAGHSVNQLTRQRWQSEWSRYIHERNLWQRVAFLALGTNILAILIVAWFGSQNRIIPYIVEVDKLGVATAVQRADTPMVANAAIIKSHLAHWIENTRSVYTDVPAEKKAITQAYAAINHNSAASTLLNDWYNKNQPFKRAETEAVTVQIESVHPLAKKPGASNGRKNNVTAMVDSSAIPNNRPLSIS